MLREISSGGIVFKKENGKTYWLVCRSNPSKEFPNVVWRLPKGWIDDKDNGKFPGVYASGEKRASDDLLQKSAIREVKEEGGVNARIIEKIGTERFFYNSKDRGGLTLKFVTFYLMEYLKDSKDGFDFETAEVKWLPFSEAQKLLTHKGEKAVLEKAREKLESGIQGNLI